MLLNSWESVHFQDWSTCIHRIPLLSWRNNQPQYKLSFSSIATIRHSFHWPTLNELKYKHEVIDFHPSSRNYALAICVRDSRGHSPFGGPGTGLRIYHVQSAEYLEKYPCECGLWISDGYYSGFDTGMFESELNTILNLRFYEFAPGLARWTNAMPRFLCILTSTLPSCLWENSAFLFARIFLYLHCD